MNLRYQRDVSFGLDPACIWKTIFGGELDGYHFEPARSNPVMESLPVIGHEVPVLLYGAGGHGRVVLEAALSQGLRVEVVVDDEPHEKEFCGRPLLRGEDVKRDHPGSFQFVVAVGDNGRRAEIFQRLLALGGTPVSVVHRCATVSGSARIGRGTVVFAGAVANAEAVIGDNCIINTAATVDHECVVGAHAHLCPGVHLAGNVSVGEGAMVGVGTATIPGVKIGAWSVVGAGSVVVRDIPDHVVAFGSPAVVRRSTDPRECGVRNAECGMRTKDQGPRTTDVRDQETKGPRDQRTHGQWSVVRSNGRPDASD